jgi:hypothetical protein
MHQYEIRILRDNNRPLVVSSRFLGDFHAIRRGQSMAEDDEGLEVWRGMKCIYRRDPLPQELRDETEPSVSFGAMAARGHHPPT